MLRRPEEYESPSCATIGGDFWFPDAKVDIKSARDAAMAKSICNRCPHKTECAQWGIFKEYFGIWGGLNQRERQAIRQQRGITIRQEEESA